MALRGDGGRRAQGRLRSWAGGAGFGDMGSAPIVTLGGGGWETHILTGTRCPSHSRVFTSKEHLPFVRGSFQHGLSTQTLGLFRDATSMGNTEPPHISLTAGRAQFNLPQTPPPLSFPGAPRSSGRALRAPWAGGTRWEPVDTSTIPWAAGEAAAELRPQRLREREHGDTHDQYS